MDGLCCVLEEDPMLRTGAPSKYHDNHVNNVAGFHSLMTSCIIQAPLRYFLT